MDNQATNKLKTIMIFGAGINQLELIKAAKELGVVSVVIDPQTDPPGRGMADYYYQVDGKDYVTTKRIAIHHRIDGLVTGQMEKPMRLMARLAEDIGLDFHSPRIVEQCLDKWLMKQAFMKHSVPCAKGILVQENESIKIDQLTEYLFPLIIKPRDAFSSRGVYKVESESDLMDRFIETRSYASNGDVLIEEYMQGREFSVETITWKGHTTIVQYTQKYITPYPNTVEMAHLQPAELSNGEKEYIAKVVISGINALEINNSAAHSEIMLTSDGPRIIEIGARLGGDFISSHLTRASTGISMDRTAVQVALGVQPDLCPNKSNYSLIKYFDLPVGRKVQKILSYDELLQQPGVVFAIIFTQPNDIIAPITHSALRPGCILVKADSLHEVFSLADRYTKLLSAKVILG